MKKIFWYISVIIFFFGNIAFSQTVFSPSFYYTYGDYSTGSFSNDASVYASIKIAAKGDYLIAGFDKLLIKNPAYNFDQKMIVAGIIKNEYPFYFKLNYAYINGSFESNANPVLNYTDKTNLINGGLLYNFDLFFVGFTYTYLNLDGLKSINSHQIETDFIWQASPNFILSVKPLYTQVTDGRKLFSTNVKFDFPVSNIFKLSGDVSVGERAYYFNPELLTIYNQDETQKTTASVRAEYQFIKAVRIVVSYQYAEFDKFNINYFIGGIKLSL